MMNDTSTVMRYAFQRLKTKTEKSIKKINPLVSKGIEVTSNKILLIEKQSKLQSIARGRVSYQKHLRKLSTADHPFSVLSSEPQSTATVESKMQFSLNHIKALKEQFNIPDRKNKLDRVDRQIPDAAKQIDNWWGWVNNSLGAADIKPELKNWLLYYLLPAIYWRSRLTKTRSKKIKRIYGMVQLVSI